MSDRTHAPRRRIIGVLTLGAAALAVLSLMMSRPAAAQVGTPQQLVDEVVGTFQHPFVVQTLDTVCRTVKQIRAGLPEPVGSAVGPVVVPVESVVCAASSLGFQYVIALRTDEGDRVTIRNALAGTPDVIDVDGDGVPDLVALIQLTGANQYTFSVNAVPNSSPLPVRIEAIFRDPTQGSLPRKFINIGYDARTSSSPSAWSVTATVGSVEASTTIDLTQTIVSTGPSITTVGGLFDAGPIDREAPLSGSLTYSPVPATASFGITVGDRLGVRAGSTPPVALHAEAVIDDGARHVQAVATDISALPASMSLEYVQPGEDERIVTYTAATTIPSISSVYTDTLRDVLRAKAVVNATNLPTGMVLRQTGPASATFATSAGTALGSVEVGFANGEPELMEVDNPYAKVVSRGSFTSIAGRIDNLASAAIEGSASGLVGDLQLGAGPRPAFDALVDTPGLTITGRVSNLPRHMTLTMGTQQVIYDGHGETVDRIDAEARANAGTIFGRVKTIDAVITDLPPVVTLELPTAAGFSVETDAPIGEVYGLLTSGPAPTDPLGASEYGAVLEDVASHYTAEFRIPGIQKVSLAIAGSQVTANLKMASQPVTLGFRDQTMTADASLSAVPDDVTLTMDPAANRYVYTASATIAQIEVSATKASGTFFGRVKRIEGTIQGLPQSVTLNLGTGGGLALTTNAPIGEVYVLLSSGPNPTTPLGAGVYGARVEDLTSHFTAEGRIAGLQEAAFSNVSDVMRATLKVSSTPLTLGYKTDSLTVLAALSAIPSQVALTMYNAVEQHGFARDWVVYNASAPISRIDVTLDKTTPLFGRVKHIEATLTGIPSTFELRKTTSVSGQILEVEQPISTIEVTMTDGTATAVRMPVGKSGANLTDTTAAYALSARVSAPTYFGLHNSAGTVTAQVGFEATQDLDLDLAFGANRVIGHIDDLPRTITLSITPGGLVTYNASSTIPSMTINANLGGSTGKDMSISLQGIPTSFQAGVLAPGLPDGSGVLYGIRNTSSAITRIDATIKPATAAAPTPLPDEQTNVVRLRSRTSDSVQVRIFDLSSFSFFDASSDPTETLPGSTWVNAKATFGSDPKPFTLDFQGGTTAKPVDVTVTDPSLPRSIEADLYLVRSAIYFEWRASAATDVGLTFDTTKAAGTLSIMLPSETKLCLGSDHDCFPNSKDVLLISDPLIGSDTYGYIPNGLVLDIRGYSSAQTSSDFGLSGTVCVPAWPSDSGYPTNDNVYGRCGAQSNPAKKTITIDALRTRGVHLEYGDGFCTWTGTGLKFKCGAAASVTNPAIVEDDAEKIYFSSPSGLWTGPNGIDIQNTATDKRLKVVMTAQNPLKVHACRSFDQSFCHVPGNTGSFFVGLDMSGIPTRLDEKQVNALDCRGLSLWSNLPALGFTEVVQSGLIGLTGAGAMCQV